MSPGWTKRTGTGYWTGPAVKPSGSWNLTVTGAPESPGLVQYTCHSGFSRNNTPTVNGSPARTAVVSASNSALTRSWFGAAAAAPAVRLRTIRANRHVVLGNRVMASRQLEGLG